MTENQSAEAGIRDLAKKFNSMAEHWRPTTAKAVSDAAMAPESVALLGFQSQAAQVQMLIIDGIEAQLAALTLVAAQIEKAQDG